MGNTGPESGDGRVSRGDALWGPRPRKVLSEAEAPCPRPRSWRAAWLGRCRRAKTQGRPKPIRVLAELTPALARPSRWTEETPGVLGRRALDFTADRTCMHGHSLGHIVPGMWLLPAARGALGPCWGSRPIMTSQSKGKVTLNVCLEDQTDFTQLLSF